MHFAEDVGHIPGNSLVQTYELNQAYLESSCIFLGAGSCEGPERSQRCTKPGEANCFRHVFWNLQCKGPLQAPPVVSGLDGQDFFCLVWLAVKLVAASCRIFSVASCHTCPAPREGNDLWRVLSSEGLCQLVVLRFFVLMSPEPPLKHFGHICSKHVFLSPDEEIRNLLLS